MASWFGGWGGALTGAPPTLAPSTPATPPPTQTSLGTYPGLSQSQTVTSERGPGGFAVGEIVEYHSATQGSWIPAKVLAVNPNGTYSLDCKPDVPVEKIRPRGGAPLAGSTATFDGAEHQVGDVVEYYSATQGGWIPAKVLSVNPRGTYNLDCKPEVLPDKVRKRGPQSRPSSPSHAALGSGSLAAPPPSRVLRSQGAADLPAPVQLLRVVRTGSRWRYEVCPEGAAALERHGTRNIAVTSICGLYRTGKSFLLNLLLERVQHGLPLFQIGNTSNACTQGLWLWGSVDSDDDRSPLLAFLDCEGFGSTDSDRTRDAQLMTLCALLSSVLVLNTKGALNEGLFNSLALTCRFAEHVEENGGEISRPVLLWVLRDFMLELRDTTGATISPDEYLEQALHAAPSVSMDQERSQSAREVRRSLLKFFSHRSCCTLVQPAIEESHLQNLNGAPYSSLRGEFRTGAEALRAQLISTCRANPKTLAGQPLGCFAFVALMRQLVDAMNDSKMLSVKGAWDSVQHSACGALADELRGSSARLLRTLAAGQPLPGGAQLPMTDEALRTVLRDQRHVLKAQWDERAVGDEDVRKEYWQELKETLAREEQAVRQQNARLGDQRLQEMLKAWQDWLDNENGQLRDGEQLSTSFGQLMERMPAAPLSRAGRAAIEAAARRVAAARTAVVATVEQSAEARRRAVELGEHAAQKEGAARTELQSKHTELLDAQERHKRAQTREHEVQMELQSRTAELNDAKTELQAALKDVEEARGRDAELQAQQRTQAEKEVTLRAELEEVRAVVAEASAKKLASERTTRAAADVTTAEQQRLEAELEAAKAEAERYADMLASERAVLQSQNQKTRSEHVLMVEDARRQLDVERTALQSESEKTRSEQERMVEEARKQLREERERHASALHSEQDRLIERERNAGVLEGQVAEVSSQNSSLRDRIAELQVALQEAEKKAGRQRQESARLRVDKERALQEVERVNGEHDARAHAMKQEHADRLEEVLARRKKGVAPCGRNAPPPKKAAPPVRVE